MSIITLEKKEILDKLYPYHEFFFNNGSRSLTLIKDRFYKDFELDYAKPDRYYNLAILRFIHLFFKKEINIKLSEINKKTFSFVKTLLIPYPKNFLHAYFIHIDGNRLKFISKVHLYKLKYLINGQILKGVLKGTPKDKELMQKFISEYNNQIDQKF